MMHSVIVLLLSSLVGFLSSSSVRAQDLPGSADYPSVGRLSGSTLFGYQVKSFEAVEFQTSTFTKFDLKSRKRVYAQPPLTLEGKLTRLWYEAPGVSSTEACRNYANQLTSVGFNTLYDSSKDPAVKVRGNFLARLTTEDEIPSNRTAIIFSRAKEDSIRTGTFQKDQLTVRVICAYVAKLADSYKAREGSYIAVDVLEQKPMEQHMVVSADALSQTVSSTGRAAVYGVLFDTGKSDVKAESRPSLEQIALLLKNEPALKLHVVGHTDNVGVFASNLSLSQRRANAIVKSLTSEFGIAANRLLGNGVASLAPVAPNTSDEGRAKNRRVELVAQ